MTLSDEYYEWIDSHNRDDETMEETVRRLTGGPHPEEVAGILSEETAEKLKQAVDRTRASDADRKQRARDVFSEDDSWRDISIRSDGTRSRRALQ